MIGRLNFVLACLAYYVLLSWIYINEIVLYWGYMGFKGEFSFAGFVMSLLLSIIISSKCPIKDDSRSILLVSFVFIYFIPSIIYFSYSVHSFPYIICFMISISIVYGFSHLEVNIPYLGISNASTYLYSISGAILAALVAQAAFGGLSDFNLDIEKVYDFRRDAADRMPPIFAYVYSNVSSTLIPILIVASIQFKKYWIIPLAFVMTIFMFGMSHHKSVLFGPIFVLLLYYVFSIKGIRKYIYLIFLLIPIFSISEIFVVRNFPGDTDYAYWTSLFIRRVLFVPPMLDGTYVQFFSENIKYYWSQSILFSWALENPYGMNAPFVIGFEYFSDLDTSANTGMIGSGFANASYAGVIFYAAISGLLISIFNSLGKNIGASAVAAMSFTMVFNILTSTDLVTAFLTHGLLLILILLALYPRQQLVSN